MRRESDVEAGERKWIERVTGCGMEDNCMDKRDGTEQRPE